MKTIVCIAAVISLVGCATEPVVPPATKSERDTALLQYMNCLFPYAKRMDDGRSDAKTIAQALHGACSRELEMVYEVNSRGETAYFKQSLREQGASFEEATALRVVLKARTSNSRPEL